MKKLIYSYVVLLLSSCATGPLDSTGTFLPPAHMKMLLSAPLCCSSYKDFQFERLTKNKEVKSFITTKSSVYEFKEGRSFFWAIELPSEPVKFLTVKTEPVNMLWNRTGHVLVPAVLFLDDHFNIIDTFKPSYEARNPKVIGGSWAEATIPIPTLARYSILIDSKTSDGIAWPDSDQPSGLLFVRSGPTGEVSLLAN